MDYIVDRLLMEETVDGNEVYAALGMNVRALHAQDAQVLEQAAYADLKG
jgi:hypothetical protein